MITEQRCRRFVTMMMPLENFQLRIAGSATQSGQTAEGRGPADLPYAGLSALPAAAAGLIA
jgi:hypothetical protein